MKAKYLYMYSPDVDDLEHAIFDECFNIFVQFYAGPVDLAGEESFDIEVCSPTWLDRELGDESILSGRHLILMKTFSYKRLEAFLKEVCAVDGLTWDECANKIARIGMWEFEDYKLLRDVL